MNKTMHPSSFQIIIRLLILLLLTYATPSWSALSIRYQQNIQGGATMIGNSFYLKTTDWDTAYPIIRADIDGDSSTVISSSANLQLPPGAIIQKAFLSAETMYGIAGGSSAFTSLKFKVPGGSYTTLTTASTGYLTRNIYNDAPGTGYDRYYRQIVFDVTSYLPSNPIGTYTVADPLPNSDAIENQMGGWSLVVVYWNPSPTAQFRNVTVADNWNFFNTAGEFVNVDIPNVTVPSSGLVKAVVGMTGTYGDPLLTDYIRIGQSGGTLYDLTDPTTGLTNDALGGSIGWASTNNVSTDGGGIVSGNFTARNPNTGFSTNYSNYYTTPVTSAMYDADIFDASNKLPNSSTPITVRVQQNSDGGDWLISGTYFVSVDVPSATLTKTMSPTSISSGSKTTYSFTIANTATGSVNLTGLGFVDSMPSALKIATPNGFTTTCSGASVSAPADGSTVTVSGINLNAGQTCTINIDAVAKDGQFNASCATNPAAFTNGSSNITTLDGLLKNSVTAQCLIVPPSDYSDAPATYGTPSHTIVSGVRLGATAPDNEAAAQPSTGANLDDTTGTDDEDGITLPTLTQGQTASITATVAGAGGYLQGWIDWNGDGDFADSGEQVATNIQDNTGSDTNATTGTITFSVSVPAGAVTTQTYARFRWSSTSGLNSTAVANDGEVEDYVLTVTAATTVPNTLPVVPGAPALTCPSIITNGDFENANSGDYWAPQRSGAVALNSWSATGGGTDSYSSIITGSTAINSKSLYFGNGGVKSVAPALSSGFTYDANLLATNTPSIITIRNSSDDVATVSGASPGTTTQCCDYGGQPISAQQTFTTTVGQTYRLRFSTKGEGGSGMAGILKVEAPGGSAHVRVPAVNQPADHYTFEFTATAATSTIRFTNYGHFYQDNGGFCDPSNSGFCTVNGLAGGQQSSEAVLDDVQVAATSCATDRSDAPIATTSYGEALHFISTGMQLGASIDNDPSTIANTAANGDGADDDGIIIPTLTQGQTATITATVAGAGGYLQSWIDFNGDGDFADSGEQVATNIQDNLVGDTNNTAGTIAFNLTVPAGATTSQTYARFRWSSTSGLNSTATANDGEVEDYALTLGAGSADLSLTKTLGSQLVAVGSNASFILTVTNAGIAPASNVEVTELLPSGLSYVSATTTNGNYDSTTGKWTLSSPIAVGSSATLTLTASVNASGVYRNRAWISASSATDPDSSTNVGFEADDLSDGIADDDEAEAVVAPYVATVPACNAINAFAGWDNGSPAPATGTMITTSTAQNGELLTISNTAPTSGSFAATSPNYVFYDGVSTQMNTARGGGAGGKTTYTFSVPRSGMNMAIGDVGTGESQSVIGYLGTTAVYPVWRTLNNGAVIQGANAEIMADSDGGSQAVAEFTFTSPVDRIEVIGVDTGDYVITAIRGCKMADLSLTKTASVTSASANDPVDFTLTVTNAWKYANAGVKVTDLLPSGYTYVSATPSQGTYDVATGIWDVGTVAGNGSVTLTLATTLKTSGSTQNNAAITAASLPDPDSSVTIDASTDDLGDGIVDDDEASATVTATIVDYSDAPASYGIPSHKITNSLYLGTTTPDAESAQPTPLDGSGDDATGADDEDGITLPTLNQGQTATITATVAGAGGYLQSWIDFNGDGDFADSGEQVATNIQDNLVGDTNNTAGTIAFNLTVPAGATTSQTYARFRWSTTLGLDATSSAINGEVEDYPVTINATQKISGVVFEDMNYGGGAGRTQTASSGSGVNGAKVELYDNAGTLVSTTTTANDGTKDGVYNFTSLSAGNYYVRVVSESVNSTRTGSNGTELAVQTFRTDGTTAITGEVGGRNPALADGVANTGTETLNTTTFKLSNGGHVQSLQAVTLATTDVTGIDFGFNFDTIVNTNDAGQGSLRQFILNSNLLGGEASLAQAGSRKRLDNTNEPLPAGYESSIFMIPNSALTSGVAKIQITSSASLLPSVVGSKTILDASTQTTNQGDTNTGFLGTGGTVGVDALTLAKIPAPEVELFPAAAGYNYGVHLNNTGVVIRGFAGYGFGNDINSNGVIVVGSSGNSVIIEQNILGTTASSFTVPSLRGQGSSIQTGASGGFVRNNLIGFSGANGLRMNGNTWTVKANEIRGNGLGSADGLWGYFGSNMTIEGNLITDNASGGYDGLYRSSFINNTVTYNGRDASSPEDYGVSVVGDGSLINRNIFTNNTGQGVLIYNNVHPTTLDNWISQNSMFANGKLGIDLVSTVGNTSGDNVSINDANDSDTGANRLLNFPQVKEAHLIGGMLTLRGCAPAGAIIELFEADVSPTAGSGVSSGANQLGKTQDYGEGERYLLTLTEGVGEDASSNPVNCATLTDTDSNNATGMNPFQWTIALPTGVVSGDRLTATATLSGSGTSEFSALAIVEQPLDYSDAPASYGSPTHIIISGTHLGSVPPDNEAAASPTVNADGDDVSGTDDEEGITLPTEFTPREITSVSVAVAGTGGKLQAWIDWNADGDFADTGEQIAKNLADNAGTDTDASVGVISFNVTPPATAVSGNTYARFRWSTQTNLSATAAANDGEVEDYAVTIVSGGTPLSIAGRVYHDLNVNGLDDNEAGLKDVVVVLQNVTTGTCTSMKTAADGSYQFDDLLAGDYTVTEAVGAKLPTPATCPSTPKDPNGFTSSTANVLTIALSTTAVNDANFGDVKAPVFSLDNSKVILPNSTISYPHTFQTYVDGNVLFSIAQEAADPNDLNWSASLFLDTNCDAKLGQGDTAITTALAVNAGTKLCILAKVLAPADAPAGALHVLTVSSDFQYGDASLIATSNIQTHTDRTQTSTGTNTENPTKPISGEGKLSLEKTVWNVTRNIEGNVALPGETLRYTIHYENIGNGLLNELAIQDSVPEFTQLVPNSLLCDTTPPELTTCSPQTSGNSLEWVFTGQLKAGSKGQVSYNVIVE